MAQVTAADILALVERVESAKGADREIDEAVEVAVRGGEAVHGQTRFTGEPTVGIKRPNASYIGGYAVDPCYPLTASLDAVLALVAEKLPERGSDILHETWSTMAKRYAWHMRLPTAGELATSPRFALAAFLRAYALASTGASNRGGVE